MSIPEWLFMAVVVSIATLFALLIVVGIVLVLIGAFAKGCDKTRESIIHGRKK